MADVKINGDISPTNNNNTTSNASSGGDVTTALTSSGATSSAARSVISITGSNVTITSTDRDGGRRKSPTSITTTPLRSSKDPDVTGKAHVSDKMRDSQFVTALSQKFQGGSGPLVVPSPSSAAARSAPASLSTSSGPSASHTPRSSDGSTALNKEDLTSKLSHMLQLQQHQQQQQQQRKLLQQKAPDANGSVSSSSTSSSSSSSTQAPTSPSALAPSPPQPPVMMVNGGTNLNGGGTNTSSITTPTTPTTTSITSGDRSGASSPDIPPPPPPSALHRSVSEQPALRKVPDASYTPRPKSYSTQSSMAPGDGSGNPAGHNKNDLMAALTAVVTSGAPAAGLRKTRGPGKGAGVTEVYASKKTATTPISRKE